MIAHERAAARARIEALEWMAPETKEAALAKLDAMRVKVAFPDEWRTYEAVNIEESLAASLLSASIAETKRWLARVGKPVDREEWFALPQEVNAYYDPSNNEFVMMAGMLQPPYFDHEADLASNYGAIGAIIGHEIIHGFDQGGSQFDAKGNLADWWTEEDYAEFETLTADVVEQFSTIEVLPGLFVDGELTIGENIADLGGIQIAYDALQLALAESGGPGLVDGLTQDQRFFLANAFAWAMEVRDEALRTQLETDFHAPEAVRGVQPARNMDAFYEAFDIGPSDPMYLPPEERIGIW
jgi:putative endopeptidase